MESVKLALASSLLQVFGPGCVMELDTKDRCIKIELPVSRDHVIFVRPDDYETHFLCHYAHKADLLELLCDKNGDTLAWKQRNIAQLPRKVKGFMRDFAPAAMWYAKQAAERIESTKGLGGRRADTPIIETFREARAREFRDPEPRKAEVVVVAAAEKPKRKAEEGGKPQNSKKVAQKK
jgi:hypothetical protein